MKRLEPLWTGMKAALLFALMLLPQFTDAQQQFFTYNQYGDVLVGIRRPGNATYEVVADFSNVLTFVGLPVGTVTNITVFSTNNLNDAFGASSYSNLQWSVLASFPLSASWSNYHSGTLWFTLPRTDPSTQTTPPVRQTASLNQTAKNDIVSIGNNAGQNISPLLYGKSTNSDNDFEVLLEPVGNNDPGGANYGNEVYSYFVAEKSFPGSASDTESDFGGSFPYSVENVTPASFSSATVSDFYQYVPTGFADPTSGLTSGNATYLGYFTFYPNGTMTFTRQSSSSGGGTTPPPPSVLTISRVNGTNTINFTTTNGATYTLYFTNSSGLKSPLASWPTVPTNVTGNGSINSFIDVTTDSNRFYLIGGH